MYDNRVKYPRPLNHYHRNSYYITLGWRTALVIALVVGLGLIGVWKLVNHDFCPAYYNGTTCLINK